MVLLIVGRRLAAQAKADEGPSSDAYKKYTFYAAYCYSRALVDNPSNPDIYTAIGAEFIVLDQVENQQPRTWCAVNSGHGD